MSCFYYVFGNFLLGLFFFSPVGGFWFVSIFFSFSLFAFFPPPGVNFLILFFRLFTILSSLSSKIQHRIF